MTACRIELYRWTMRCGCWLVCFVVTVIAIGVWPTPGEGASGCRKTCRQNAPLCKQGLTSLIASCTSTGGDKRSCRRSAKASARLCSKAVKTTCRACCRRNDETCALAVAAVAVPPGGSADSDAAGDGATPGDPLELEVLSPTGGIVTLVKFPYVTEVLEGVVPLAGDIVVTAPPASGAAPLQLEFELDASRVPSEPAAATVLRDGAEVPPCTDAGSAAAPDPCVSSRESLVDGTLRIGVRTSTASRWVLAQPIPASVVGCIAVMCAPTRLVACVTGPFSTTAEGLSACGAWEAANCPGATRCKIPNDPADSCSCTLGGCCCIRSGCADS